MYTFSLFRIPLVFIQFSPIPQWQFQIEDDVITGKEYPDGIEQKCSADPVALVATGVGVREKTFMKVDVYTIVSYMKEGIDLGDDGATSNDPGDIDTGPNLLADREVVESFLGGGGGNVDNSGGGEAGND